MRKREKSKGGMDIEGEREDEGKMERVGERLGEEEGRKNKSRGNRGRERL